VRLYLVASLVYFVVSAAAPNLRIEDPRTGQARQVKIGLWTPDEDITLTPAERADADRQIAKAPPFLQPVLRNVAHEPAKFRQRMVSIMPRVLFALVPVFAGILAMFYWRRPYSQHLLFALHFHTVVFLAMAIGKLANFSYNLPLAVVTGLASVLFIAYYALRGLHRVYSAGWVTTIVKAAGIAAVYVIAATPALLMALVWAALFAD
jgi:hypothetical protein